MFYIYYRYKNIKCNKRNASQTISIIVSSFSRDDMRDLRTSLYNKCK